MLGAVGNRLFEVLVDVLGNDERAVAGVRVKRLQRDAERQGEPAKQREHHCDTGETPGEGPHPP